MRLGIIGGSFSPPHKDHKQIALDLIKRNIVDKVIFVPVSDEYGKDSLISFQNRYEMLKLMFKNNNNISLSDYELGKGKLYAYQVFNYFTNLYPKDMIYFIMGMDNLNQIFDWKKGNYILEKYNILAITRDNLKMDNRLKKRPNVLEIKVESSNFSSTDIRKKIKNTEDLSEVLDKNVIDYIKTNNLYL
jgi:nicotinate (nicotinamide) nucleotide adenylyltransferase